MPILQLELSLWQQLTQAQQSPQAADWQQPCLAFDKAIAQTSTAKKLATAAKAKLMATVRDRRAITPA